MSTYKLPEGIEIEKFLRRIYGLAFRACASPFGNDNQKTTIDVAEFFAWGSTEKKFLRDPGDFNNVRLRADYIGVSMMKLTVVVKDGKVLIPDYAPVPSHHGWCWCYETFDKLFVAADRSLST